ncbi:MAG: TetR/AcrR family transcriptional regulator [Candidatus Methylomirabilia bacterium]
MAVHSIAPRLEKKRRRILDAASRIFAERDYHAVSMDEVARVARVGKGTLYRYFDSKEDLYLSLIDEALVLLTDRLEEEQRADLPPAEALSRMIRAIVQTFCQHLPAFRVINSNEARLLLTRRQLFLSRRRRIALVLGRVLERGAATGVFRDVSSVVTPSLLIGMVWGAVLYHSAEVTPEALATTIADAFLHGALQP